MQDHSQCCRENVLDSIFFCLCSIDTHSFPSVCLDNGRVGSLTMGPPKKRSHGDLLFGDRRMAADGAFVPPYGRHKIREFLLKATLVH